MDFNDRRQMRALVVPHLSKGASQYAASMGQSRPSDFSQVVVNPTHGRQMAQEYEAAPLREEHAVPHYKAMALETHRQFEFLTKPTHKGGMGISVEAQHEDPYKHVGEAHQDITENKRLKVLSTAATGGHPFFSNDVNDMFRAVHDAFGHLATGRGFDRHGEEAAFRSHAAMFSKMARPAMASETRGQNSTFIFGSSPGTFPTQKITVVKSALHTPLIGRRSVLGKQLSEAVQMHSQYFPLQGRSST